MKYLLFLIGIVFIGGGIYIILDGSLLEQLRFYFMLGVGPGTVFIIGAIFLNAGFVLEGVDKGIEELRKEIRNNKDVPPTN